MDPAAAFGLYSTPVTQDIVEDSKPVPTEVEVVGTARLQEMDAESRTTAQVIEAARLNRAEAQQYDSGSREWAKPEFCPECGNTDIGEYESTSKQHPGRRYYQCSFAYEERLRMLSEGMNGTKVNAALSKHARKWAEPPIKKEAAGPEPVEIPPVEGHLANAESVAGARTPQAGKQPAPAAESADKWFARERQRITEEVDRRSDLTMSQKMDAIRDALESARKKYDTMLALEG